MKQRNSYNISEKLRIVENYYQSGLTQTDYCISSGIPRRNLARWLSDYRYKPEKFGNIRMDTGTYNVTPVVNNNLNRERTKIDKNNILDFIENLSPINSDPPQRKIYTEDNGVVVVASDFHFGCHDEKAIDIFLETVDRLKPSSVILNGDTLDFLAISRYPKDIKQKWSLMSERIAYHDFLSNLIGVIGQGTTIYETYSNHSGQSIGGRWRRYLSERIGELGDIPEVYEALDYSNIFLGNYKKDVMHVDYVELNSLLVTHGETVRKNGGYSARGEIEKWGNSVLHGHTHRIGSTCQRIPSIGSRPERQIYGFEGGCMCSLDAVYSKAPNWQQGFCIVTLDDNGVDFGLEQVYIQNGRATISTLGQTVHV